MRILAVSGSLQARSGNRALLELAQTLCPDGVELAWFDGVRELPHFNPDVAVRDAPPAVRAWRQAITACDALLIATPEYGHSLPGALKNAIDWVIGSGELESKIVGITASVPGAERGRLGLSALAVTLGAVSATVVGGEPIVRGPDEARAVEALLLALIAAVRAASAAP